MIHRELFFFSAFHWSKRRIALNLGISLKWVDGKLLPLNTSRNILYTWFLDLLEISSIVGRLFFRSSLQGRVVSGSLRHPSLSSSSCAYLDTLTILVTCCFIMCIIIPNACITKANRPIIFVKKCKILFMHPLIFSRKILILDLSHFSCTRMSIHNSYLYFNSYSYLSLKYENSQQNSYFLSFISYFISGIHPWVAWSHG